IPCVRRLHPPDSGGSSRIEDREASAGGWLDLFLSIQELQLAVRPNEVLLRNLPEESPEERARRVAGTIGILGRGLVISFCSRIGVVRCREDIFHKTLPCSCFLRFRVQLRQP